ncbi:uncharacterized protein DUF4361 [Arcticibacter tournemirensis]|uniref:DUF4973 domain-containing protein n=1 Tax=Arcticibacter tournemirensis TaxID=699437 RepID=A0A5M9GRS6_9SPHI|nr:DUF4973 domain-containing protein [Arcticibacter tournemirensis]KAA8476401.1 DUF4973 domain-containing protein [Arcticibacter tournemirensis]TQM51254.1 uncharacterized protein DUF4361 [Arcticibacter tournemirensis]
MKSFYKYIVALTLIMPFAACNDEWEEELFTNMVSFKAPIGSEGVTEVYLRYKKDGEVEYNLPVIVSGTQENQKDLNVQVEVDNDTLNIFNQGKYQYRTDLYFKQLPAQFFELPAGPCFIPKGSHTANHKIKFKFFNLDLVERWVLPLTIKDDPSYAVNYRKGWRKALLYVKPFNDYSGSYSATSMNIVFDSDTEPKTMVMSTKNAWVVDENTVFFYAGMVEERSEERGDYKILMRFGEPVENADGSRTGALTVQAENPAINFELLSQPTYQIKKVVDPTLPYLVSEYTTVNIKYKYNDITSIPNMPIRYKAEGSMTMERRRNITIPDDDQAIQW